MVKLLVMASLVSLFLAIICFRLDYLYVGFAFCAIAPVIFFWAMAK
jgi:hypothetical protein